MRRDDHPLFAERMPSLFPRRPHPELTIDDQFLYCKCRQSPSDFPASSRSIGVDFDVAAGEIVGARRRERRRQVDADEDPRPASIAPTAGDDRASTACRSRCTVRPMPRSLGIARHPPGARAHRHARRGRQRVPRARAARAAGRCACWIAGAWRPTRSGSSRGSARDLAAHDRAAAVHCAAAVRRDRARAVDERAAAGPRRADRQPRLERGRAAVSPCCAICGQAAPRSSTSRTG